jgi:HlyD family secretion protein
VDITVDAYPDELFQGTVARIDPEAVVNQNVTTIAVTVNVDTPDARLKPGMNVTCDFITAKRDNVLLVANEAIKEGNSGSTVQVMENGVPVTRKVEIGLMGTDKAEVLSGLKEGDVVVTAIIQPVSAATQTNTTRGPGMGFGMGGGMRGGH